jgi:hypothetical protein
LSYSATIGERTSKPRLARLMACLIRMARVVAAIEAGQRWCETSWRPLTRQPQRPADTRPGEIRNQ